MKRAPKSARALISGRRMHQCSNFDRCALCGESVGSSRMIAFALFGEHDAIAYLLCGQCFPGKGVSLSSNQMNIIDFKLEIDAERLGILARGSKT